MTRVLILSVLQNSEHFLRFLPDSLCMYCILGHLPALPFSQRFLQSFAELEQALWHVAMHGI